MPPKAHAWVGPSSIARVLACPPSARFSEQFPDTESDFAAEGTEASRALRISGTQGTGRESP
ncbi:DUF2800 domain-containing protein [Ruminococcus sp.]|uniref:DUF2800 domain-containing protein n=1 Tax=Ruminococcus sp. TaxID=41978 RepID=UPI003994F05C